MRELDISNWNRKQHFEHFIQFNNPYFAVTVDFDVTNAFKHSKETKKSFFAFYLHACMKAINKVDNFKYRIIDGKVLVYERIHASATISREDNTYGCSFIHFDEDFEVFNNNFQREKQRILTTTDLFPPQNTFDCIYCSAMPWFNFSGHTEPHFGAVKESVPKLAFGKYLNKNNRLMMPVAIAVNHALVDGYHVGLFVDEFQKNLSEF